MVTSPRPNSEHAVKISQKAVHERLLLYPDHDRPAGREMAVQMAYASLSSLRKTWSEYLCKEITRKCVTHSMNLP
jgi:hypothetical protein